MFSIYVVWDEDINRSNLGLQLLQKLITFQSYQRPEPITFKP